jgi:hypothetical protein
LGFLLVANVAHRPFSNLQARDDGVQIHAVDTLDLQHDMLLQDFGD